MLKYGCKFKHTLINLENNFLIEMSFGSDILERTYDIQDYFNEYFKVLIGEERRYLDGGNVNSIKVL